MSQSTTQLANIRRQMTELAYSPEHTKIVYTDKFDRKMTTPATKPRN